MSFLSVRVRRARFWWHLLVAYLLRYQFRIFIAALGIFVVVLAAFKIWPTISRSNVVSIGYVGSYTLDQIPSQVLRYATGSLTSSDKEGRALPMLSSHWTVSKDGKTYVVFLKDNLRWHDGTQVEAKDISVAITNVQITALNNKTIEFKLPNPIASFPQALNKPVFKSNSFYGTGDFRIVEIDQVGSIVKKMLLRPGKNNLPSVEIKFYPNEEQAINALKIGEIKILNAANSKDFESWQNLELKKKSDTSEIVTIFYNTKDDLLSSKDIRQGLSHAVNREGFDGEPAHSPISSSSWAYNTDVKRYEYNTAKAKELITKAEVKNPQLTLSFTPGMEEIANSIKSDWEAVGIKTEVKKEETLPKDFDALLTINKIPDDPDQYPLWHSTQKETNITGYVNVKIDKLLEDARSQTEEERKALYLDFQRFLVEDVPATFLYYPNKYEITYKNIKPLFEKLPQ